MRDGIDRKRALRPLSGGNIPSPAGITASNAALTASICPAVSSFPPEQPVKTRERPSRSANKILCLYKAIPPGGI